MLFHFLSVSTVGIYRTRLCSTTRKIVTFKLIYCCSDSALQLVYCNCDASDCSLYSLSWLWNIFADILSNPFVIMASKSQNVRKFVVEYNLNWLQRYSRWWICFPKKALVDHIHRENLYARRVAQETIIPLKLARLRHNGKCHLLRPNSPIWNLIVRHHLLDILVCNNSQWVSCIFSDSV